MSWKLKEDGGRWALFEDDGRSRKALQQLQILPVTVKKMSIAPAIAGKTDFGRPPWILEANWRPKAIYILSQYQF